jgi:hypothetical protein
VTEALEATPTAPAVKRNVVASKVYSGVASDNPAV